MEKSQSYEKLIIEGIKGLPPELLIEIANFVYFMRKRLIQPQFHEAELESVLLDPCFNFQTVQPVETGEGWLNLAGTISSADLQLMTEVIEAGCEKVDLNEW